MLPLVGLGALVGCPKKGDATASGVDAAESKSSAAAVSNAASASASASAAYPKTVVVADDKPAEPDAMVLDFEGDAFVDADLDALVGDGAALDGGDAADAHKPDAPGVAPLMGAATFMEELPAKGMRRITAAAARVHKAPKDGGSIATLTKGTEVWLVAEFLDWYRVKYIDPNTQVARQGWIYGVNFAGPRMKVCPTGWSLHDQDGGWCDRECKRNTDCKAIKGYKCSGDRCFYAAD